MQQALRSDFPWSGKLRQARRDVVVYNFELAPGNQFPVNVQGNVWPTVQRVSISRPCSSSTKSATVKAGTGISIESWQGRASTRGVQRIGIRNRSGLGLGGGLAITSAPEIP